MQMHIEESRADIARQEDIVQRLVAAGDREMADLAAQLLLTMHIHLSLQCQMLDLMLRRDAGDHVPH